VTEADASGAAEIEFDETTVVVSGEETVVADAIFRENLAEWRYAPLTPNCIRGLVRSASGVKWLFLKIVRFSQ
jgi:hypothetical protein